MNIVKEIAKHKFLDECKLIIRAFGILNKLFPRFWLLEGICLLCECVSPYFSLYMSAQIINELSGKCDLRRLLVLAVVTVCGGFVILFVTKLLQSINNVNSSFFVSAT